MNFSIDENKIFICVNTEVQKFTEEMAQHGCGLCGEARGIYCKLNC
jgi:hypothetical protein